MVLGIGAGLYGFHDAGAISDEVFLSIMIFAIAVSAGIIIAVDMERKVHRAARERWKEVPPPSDFMAVWPPKPIETIGRDHPARRKCAGLESTPRSQVKKP